MTDCILAISTLYEHPQFLSSFYSNPEGTPPTPTANDQGTLDGFHKNALEHYNDAIRALRRKILEGKVTPYLALLSCSLFLCIELIRDDVFAARELHRMGAGLLQQYEQSIETERGSGLLNMVKLMLSRVGTLAPAFAHRRLINMDLQHVPKTHDKGFASMGDARDALFAIILDTNSFVEDAHAWKESLIISTEDELPSEAHAWKQSLFTQAEHQKVSEEAGSRSTMRTVMYGVAFRMVTKVGRQDWMCSLAGADHYPSQTPEHCVTTGRIVLPEDLKTPIDLAPGLEPGKRASSGQPQQYDELLDLSRRQVVLLEQLDQWLDAHNRE